MFEVGGALPRAGNGWYDLCNNLHLNALIFFVILCKYSFHRQNNAFQSWMTSVLGSGGAGQQPGGLKKSDSVLPENKGAKSDGGITPSSPQTAAGPGADQLHSEGQESNEID